MDRKATLIACLDKFIRQRPGLEFGNYGDGPSYRAEVRSIGKDLQQARTLLRAVELRDSITADDIIEASKHAFSGRLSITEPEPGKFVLDYCVGQYWPTEYRRAVCSVLSSAIWAWLRDKCMPKPFTPPLCTGDWYPLRNDKGLIMPVSAGTYLRSTAKREFGRSIASRWFN